MTIQILLLPIAGLLMILIPSGTLICRISDRARRSWVIPSGAWLVAVSLLAIAVSRAGTQGDPGFWLAIDGLLRFCAILYIAVAVAITVLMVCRRLPPEGGSTPDSPREFSIPTIYWVISVAVALFVTVSSVSSS